MKKLAITKVFLLFSILILLTTQVSCQKSEINQFDITQEPHSPNVEDDLELEDSNEQFQQSCTQANLNQITQVNLGFNKLNQFLNYCKLYANNSTWCDQVARPNPESHNTFQCTYDSTQPHILIHPDESTWNYAVEAVRIVQDLEKKKIRTCLIYNWWRPEPYNKNVGGAAGRHPFGTSVDVQFCSKNDQLVAHKELCKMRKKGRLRALGYYSSTSLHLGVGDKTANTWGKPCP